MIIKRLALVLIAALALSACTISPEQVQHKTASQWIKENRIGYDSTGYVYTAEGYRVYQNEWKSYGTRLPVREQPGNPDDGITKLANGNYHFSFIANRRFDHMTELDENQP